MTLGELFGGCIWYGPLWTRRRYRSPQLIGTLQLYSRFLRQLPGCRLRVQVVPLHHHENCLSLPLIVFFIN